MPGAQRQGRDHIGRALPDRAPRRSRAWMVSWPGLPVSAAAAAPTCLTQTIVGRFADRGDDALSRVPRRGGRQSIGRPSRLSGRSAGTHKEMSFAANTTWDAGWPFARIGALFLCLVGRFRPVGGGGREIDPIVELGKRNLDVDLG